MKEELQLPIGMYVGHWKEAQLRSDLSCPTNVGLLDLLCSANSRTGQSRRQRRKH